jgi:hypothetical protein
MRALLAAWGAGARTAGTQQIGKEGEQIVQIMTRAIGDDVS